MPPRLPPFLSFVTVLGEGGFGEVVKAVDTRRGIEVAVKTLPLDADRETAQRQRQEAEALAALHHPNVVSLIESFESEGQHFMLMELLEGGDLLDVLMSNPGAREIVAIFADVCQGLDYIHEQGLVHRDIKPSNILFTLDGVPKIADLGLVRRQGFQSGLTQPGVLMGSAEFVSPEQILRTREVGPPGDVYSLGCALFLCLTGRYPFARDKDFELLQAHLKEPAPRLRSLKPELPPALDAVLARMLEKEPELRPAAREVRQVLLGL